MSTVRTTFLSRREAKRQGRRKVLNAAPVRDAGYLAEGVVVEYDVARARRVQGRLPSVVFLSSAVSVCGPGVQPRGDNRSANDDAPGLSTGGRGTQAHRTSTSSKCSEASGEDTHTQAVLVNAEDSRRATRVPGVRKKLSFERAAE
jgi:hypothetical protein